MILAIGEALVEFRRQTDGGPPSRRGRARSRAGAAIFASVAARLGDDVAPAVARAPALGGADGCCDARLVGSRRRRTAVAFVAYDGGGGRDFWFSVPDSAAVDVDGAQVRRAVAARRLAARVRLDARVRRTGG